MPRRASRFASIALALDRRLDTVPIGQPSGSPPPVGLALQVAQDDGDAVLLGQAAQLPVEGLGQVVPTGRRTRPRLGHVRHLDLPRPPLGPRRPRFHGRLVRHAVEPVAELLPMARSKPPCGRGRGTWPGRRPRRRGGPGGPGGRRPRPSGRGDGRSPRRNRPKYRGA